MDGGRRAGRLSAATDPCHSAVGGAAAHGPCAACAALARLWRRTSTTRDRPARQPRTARPTRRVPCRSQAVRSSWPCCAPLRRAHCRLRATRATCCARCARRDCPGAPLGGAPPRVAEACAVHTHAACTSTCEAFFKISFLALVGGGVAAVSAGVQFRGFWSPRPPRSRTRATRLSSPRHFRDAPCQRI